jgi:hypothetical protein
MTRLRRSGIAGRHPDAFKHNGYAVTLLDETIFRLVKSLTMVNVWATFLRALHQRNARFSAR